MIDLYLAGNKNEKGNPVGGLVFISPVYSSGLPSDALIKENLVLRFGGELSDYAIYKMDSTSFDGVRVTQGESVKLVWDGSNYITDIDWSIENSKKWIETFANKNIVEKNGTDYITITSKIIKSDKSGVDTNFNENLVIDIMTPAGVKPLFVKYTKGICEYNFQPENHSNSTGNYRMPANEVKGFRIKSRLEFVAVIPVG